MFKKFGLKAKLIAMSAISSTLLLIVGAVAVNALNLTSDHYDHVIHVNFPNAVNVGTMRFAGNSVLRLLTQMTLPGNDEKELKRLVARLDEEKQRFTEAKTTYDAIPFVQGEKEVFDAFIDSYQAVLKKVDDSIPLLMSGSPADRMEFANSYRGEFNKIRNNFYDQTKVLLKFHQDEAAKWTKDADDTSKAQSMLAILIVAAGFILSLAMGIIFARGLSNSLVSVSKNLVEGATQLNSAATEIATGSESLSSSASEQAAAVQETSSAVEELSAMVSKNSDNAEKSRDKASVSQQVAQKGRTVVTEMMSAISDINESNNQIMNAVEESNKNIAEITRVIMDIGAKTTVIKDIVFQTKLLSFNASVEAARAGEHGKGFSVVAEEVGNLAQMSGNAAQEISSTLEESIKKVNHIVAETKERVESLILVGKDKVERGHNIATQCGEILEQIVAEASDVSSMVVEISSSSKEQSIGIQEITKAMSQMDTVTQQNASISQTSASASVELAAQAESLTSLVSEMQSIIYGLNQAPANQPSYAPRKTEPKQSNKVVNFKPKKNGLDVPSYHDLKASGDD
ncbi:methyl-accepting chemotaxis protein [Pseudobdellovibrio sp. HCB154]|uniref:methyl-accepting chemotaxis protein n=1 Tax=Pseudobdellovibrio sp. HCB154 TaxID=3386277 RepID=UPI00391764DD